MLLSRQAWPRYSRPMATLPSAVTAGLSDEKRDVANAWWAALDEESREEFLGLWDNRAEDAAYCATIEDGKTVWHELPIQLRAYPAGTNSEKENGLWKRQLGEYVNGHEVAFFLHESVFHVCRAHACAREVGRTGVIPAGFSCPDRSATCPFESALELAAVAGQRRALVLVPVPRGARTRA